MSTELHDRKRWIALAVIVAAQFMVVLDVAIVNVALPSIKNDLHFTQESLQWVITAYSILFGGVLLLGGVLTSSLSWSWIFFVNVPVGVVILAVSPWLLRESRAELDHRYFDTAGAASITSGLMLLVYAMTRATERGWGSATTIALLGASAALIVGFVVIELRSKAPLLPMRIFRLRSLAGSNVSGLLLAAALFSQFFLLTLYMQEVLHYSALKTGVAYMTLTLAIITFAAVAQGLVTRIGVRRVLPFGLALSTAGLILFTQLPVDGRYFFDLFPGFLLSGIGLALSFVPMTIAALVGVKEADAGIASGLINTSQQIGGAIGLAAATTIATTFTNRYVDTHVGISASRGAARLPRRRRSTPRRSSARSGGWRGLCERVCNAGRPRRPVRPSWRSRPRIGRAPAIGSRPRSLGSRQLSPSWQPRRPGSPLPR